MRLGVCEAALLLLAWLAAYAIPGAAQDRKLDESWIDRAVLDKGDVSISLERDGRVSLVNAAILIDAPAESIWDVLVACEIAPEYVPNVVACRSLEVIDDGRAELFIQTVKPAFFLPSFEHVFRMDYTPYSTIDIDRVSGPIKLLESTWWLVEQPDGRILLAYTLALDPGIPIPRVFVRATLRRDLPVVLKAVKERAEAAAERARTGP